MSRGSPTFTESSRAISVRLWCSFSGNSKVAIGAVRNDCLTRCKSQLSAIELYRNRVRLERNHVGDAADFGIRFAIRPCCQMCLTDVVVAAQPFVWAEGLVFHGSQRGLI